ncbi:MerR family transcriptional regulator [Sporosarcina sp. FSL W7-1283]|uniref:MerR family transcriptional regulator n=1 Tax=Sporosarcina sp. FSL W7-1283 TaxID=2921560 RepID=UPI0030F81D4D
MDRLLLKKDVTAAVDAPKTTVNDWIHDFRAFIPIVREGRTTYYKPEAVNVLLAVKRMREEGLDKTRIARELPGLGFSIDHDEMVNKVEKARGHAEQAENARNRDGFLAVMQTMSVAMERMTELEREVQESKVRMVEQDRINRELTELIEKQAAALEKQEKYIEESLQVRDQKLMESLRLSQEAKREVLATEEIRQKEMEEIRQQQSKGFLARLFGK